MKFSTASDQSAEAGVKILAYGPAGIGKTVLCATLPKPVMISAESGALSLGRKNLERMYGVDNPDITYNMPMIVIESMNDLVDAFSFVSGPKAASFLSVAIDSISEIAESILAKEKTLTKDPRQAYGAIIDKVESLVRSYRDLPGKNVYFSAKIESAKDELTGYVKFGPSMPGSKLGPRLPYFFDEVFRVGIMKDKEGKEYRFLQTQPDMQYDAKDRSGNLDPIEYPNLSQIIRKIQGV